MSQRSHDEEADYVARMVLAIVEAVADDPSQRRLRRRGRPERERIGPSPVYHELERLLAEGSAGRAS